MSPAEGCVRGDVEGDAVVISGDGVDNGLATAIAIATALDLELLGGWNRNAAERFIEQGDDGACAVGVGRFQGGRQGIADESVGGVL